MQDTVIINQISYALDGVLQDCWHRLINGVYAARHPFHCPSIATINGSFPEIRTVVLRKVIPAERSLIFYTDCRSPKIDQLQKNNAVSWLFYDAKSNIQLRLKTVATIHHQDEIALKHWNESRLESRVCYLVQPAPATRTHLPTDGLPKQLDRFSLSAESLALGYENFAVVKNKVAQIDWLILNPDGHRRAQFIFGEKEVEMCWVIP